MTHCISGTCNLISNVMPNFMHEIYVMQYYYINLCTSLSEFDFKMEINIEVTNTRKKQCE